MSMRYPGGLIATTPVNQQYPSGVWTGPQSAPYQANNVWGSDPSFRNTSLLLQAQGPAAPFIKDSSVNNFNITINGDTRADSKTPFTPPSGVTTFGSGYFDGTGDYLSVPAGNNAFLMSGDWTLSCWIYPTSVSGVRVLIDTRKGSSSGSPVLYTNGSNLVIDTGSASVVSAGTVTINQWQHVAATRSGNSWRLYLNGAQIGSTTTNTTTYSTEYGVWIGNSFYSEFYSGYMSNVQILNGTALYTGSTYTVPTSPLATIANTSLLTLQSNVPVNNNTLIADSPSTATMIRGGSITQGSFTPYLADGYWSNYFDGSGDYLTCSSSATNFSTASFTIEFWVNFASLPSSGSNYNIISATVTNGVEVLYRGTGNYIEIGRYGVGPSLQYSWIPTLGAWNHVAFVRNSTTVTIYINGVSVTSGTVSQDFQTGTTNIGSAGGSTSYFAGYLSNVRVVKSTAVYTSNFTPSITPLTAISNTSLLTCQSNRFIDNSTNAFAITKSGDTSVQAFDPFPPSLQYTASNFYGSASLVSGDYFQVAGGSPTSIGNFSASAWVYRTSVSGSQQTFCSFGEEGPGRGVFFWTGSNFEYNIYGSSTVTIDGSGSMPVGAWTYVVLTRTGSTITLYYNGVLKATVSLGTAFTNTSDRKSGYGGVIGYVANYRLDYAAYSSPTTVPTAPVSATANTLLLANFTNAGIFDGAMQNNLVTVGNAQINTAVTKYGTGSMYFDGSGDYLSMYATPNLTFGSGDWTVECWIYLPSLSSTYYAIASQRTGDTLSTIGWALFVNTSKVGINCSNGSSSVTAENTTVLTTNTWYHVAAVRTGNNLITYVNGIGSTPASFTGSVVVAGSTTYVGFASGSAITAFSGYIDDLRITKGVARYVTNFTPPVARMPNQ